MKVIRELREFPELSYAVVTSGTFDGVHVGHQKILERLIERAQEVKGQTVVITYWPHPRLVLNPADTSLQLLSTIEERIEQLATFAIDYLLIIPFTREFAGMESIDYIRQILQETIRTKILIIGYDHRFGKNREGSFAYLQENADQYGFMVEEIPVQDIDQVAVSSTKIRRALEKGDVVAAKSFMNREYAITGQVVHGKKLGRTIGYPTANLQVADKLKLIPAQGIYAVKVQIQDSCFGGMLSIGTNPTVGGTQQTIEVHIFDFDQDIYNRIITIFFIAYIRAEEKFASIEILKAKLHEDKLAALALLGKIA